MDNAQDIILRAIFEQSLRQLPLCLNATAAEMVATDMLRALKRNGVVCEFGPVPERPARRHSDGMKGFHHG